MSDEVPLHTCPSCCELEDRLRIAMRENERISRKLDVLLSKLEYVIEVTRNDTLRGANNL